MEPLTEAISRQYDHVWAMLFEIIEKCPDDEWRVEEDNFLNPARLAYHALQAVDFHLDAEPESFDWAVSGFNWETAPPQDLPDRDAVKAYCEVVKAKAAKRILELGENGLLRPDPTFMKSNFPLALDHVIYALRHMQYHLGHIDTLLHQRGLESPEWQ